MAVVPLRSKPIGRNAHQHLLTIDLMWVHFSFLLCLRLTLVSCLVFFFPFVFVFFNVSLPLVEQGNKIPNAEAYTVLASSAQIDRDQKRRISIDYHIYPSVCTRVILHVQGSDHSTNQSILLTHPLVSSWAEAKRDWTRLDPQKRLSLSPFSFRLASMANCRPATYQLVIVSLFFFYGSSIARLLVNGFVRLIGQSPVLLTCTVRGSCRHLTRQNKPMKRIDAEKPVLRERGRPLPSLAVSLIRSSFEFGTILFISSCCSSRSIHRARLFLPAPHTHAQYLNVRDPVCILGSAFKVADPEGFPIRFLSLLSYFLLKKRLPKYLVFVRNTLRYKDHLSHDANEK